MLSPNDGSRIVLLPEDKELIKLAGWTEAEYREFVRYCNSATRITPGTPVAIGLDIILLQIGIALVLSAITYFLTPKPKTGSRNNVAQPTTTQVQGQDIVSGARYAPKAGFDSIQNVVEMGSVVPLVYARRETIGDTTYGGVRVNTNLLWSQILSLGGDQLFRGIFLVGEGDNRANSMEIDPQQFALGNNLLGNYNLAQNSTSRVSIYYSDDGGRLVDADYVAGRPANEDPGNSQTGDVFAVRGVGGTFGPNFSYAYKPGSQTSFGLFSWISNGTCLRVNPRLRPQYRVATRPLGNGNLRVVCDDDGQANVERQKQNQRFSGQSGITAGNANLAVGNEVTYQLNAAVSFGGTFTFTSGADFGATTATLTANDINTSVAARQQSFDENIVIGELYKIGSALCICTARTNALFASAAEGGNQSITATFECVRAGVMSAPPGTGGLSNATLTSQIFRLARGSFVTEYPTQVLEIGIRSSVGIQVRGLTNTIEGGYTYNNIDAQSCPAPPAVAGPFPEIGGTSTIATQQYNAGQVSVPEERYSYFRLMFREAGTDNAFTELDSLYGIRSESSQAVYNYIRLEMAAAERYEFLIEPISGWEIRSGTATGTQRVLDHRIQTETVATENGVTVRYRGVNPGTYRMNWVDPVEPALEWDDQSMADARARIAEAFCYEEISTSVGGNPEHEIVYINTILPNPTEPNYADLAIVGMNIRSSREFASLSQFSVYINRGLGGFHDFPSVLRDLLTNDRFGVGEIVSPEQIDDAAFTAATTFTNARNYYFDGAITEPLNLRTWGVERARDFLLDFIISNGSFALRPLLDFDNPEEITGIFTSGNIIEDSFELTYFDQEQRQAPRISVRWRQEQISATAGNRGLFPVVREVTVRAAGVGADAPLEQIDMSDFCTSQDHAIDRAKFECRFRTLSTHAVKFTTTTDQAALGLGKCFRLGMETLTFDQPQNGYVAEDGTVTSWTEIPDGTYTVQAWNGQGAGVTEQQLVINNGRSATLRGFVFCIANAVSRTQTYKVQSLSFNEEGNIEVEAIHWPTDAQGNSDLVIGWDTAANWIIEGEI